MYPIISASLSINVASISADLTDRSPSPSVGLCVCRSVGLSVRKVFCGKTADWIRVSFGIESGVGQGMGVLDGVHVRQGNGQFWGLSP